MIIVKNCLKNKIKFYYENIKHINFVAHINFFYDLCEKAMSLPLVLSTDNILHIKNTIIMVTSLNSML